MPHCLIFEDEHLLVVNKPSGLNTHSPAPFAGEGLYDWLRNREPRWAKLAIIHRLDKETSGVLVFSKSPEGNRSLTQQFESRAVKKKYLFLTDRRLEERNFSARSNIARAGDRYASRPHGAGGVPAETRFRFLRPEGGLFLWEAEPLTGRTHQIRVHAADHGLSILGDTLYRGSPAARVFLHAFEITVSHPVTGREMIFRTEADFQKDPRGLLRDAVIDRQETGAWRMIHGAGDGQPGWYVDRLGEFVLIQSEAEIDPERLAESADDASISGTPARGVYHKRLIRTGSRAVGESCPVLIRGEVAPDRFVAKENGLRFELSFKEGYSVGLFLDQRDNRRRALTGHAGAGFPLYPEQAERAEVLNAFAYTCAFSVCAAKHGARVTSLDLSKKYLEWGRRNFELNAMNPEEHDFIYGDVFDWMPRLAKKGRRFDVVLIDPPTFSRSKKLGVFRVEKDFEALVERAMPLLKPQGVFFCSSNASSWTPEDFLTRIRAEVGRSKREIILEPYYPQPVDFAISRDEPGYLKTVWLRVR